MPNRVLVSLGTVCLGTSLIIQYNILGLLQCLPKLTP